jgi:hypothetical protein
MRDKTQLFFNLLNFVWFDKDFVTCSCLLKHRRGMRYMAPVLFLILNVLRKRGMRFYVGDTGKIFILLSSLRSVEQRAGRIDSGRFGLPGRRRPRWRAVWAAGSSATPSGGPSLVLGGSCPPGHARRRLSKAEHPRSAYGPCA